MPTHRSLINTREHGDDKAHPVRAAPCMTGTPGCWGKTMDTLLAPHVQAELAAVTPNSKVRACLEMHTPRYGHPPQLVSRSQYIWLFQAPLLPELQMAANDYKSLEDVFLGDTFGVRTPGAPVAVGSRCSDKGRHAEFAAQATVGGCCLHLCW